MTAISPEFPALAALAEMLRAAAGPLRGGLLFADRVRALRITASAMVPKVVASA